MSEWEQKKDPAAVYLGTYSEALVLLPGPGVLILKHWIKTFSPRIGCRLKAGCRRMLNGWLGGEWQGWIGGGRLPPYPGGLHIIWAAALSAEPTLICGPRPHYGLDPHSRPHNATQGSTSAQSVRQCARVLGGKKRPDVPVPGGPGLYRLPKIGKLQKLGNWGCGRRPTGMLQFLSSQHSCNCQYIIEESAYFQQTYVLTVWLWFDVV